MNLFKFKEEREFVNEKHIKKFTCIPYSYKKIIQKLKY